MFFYALYVFLFDISRTCSPLGKCQNIKNIYGMLMTTIFTGISLICRKIETFNYSKFYVLVFAIYWQ